MKKNRLILILVATIGFAFLESCSDGEHDGYSNKETAKLEIRLTDAPSLYEKVNIDIRSMSINSTNDENSGWKDFPLFRPGVYNLTDFRNGADTLLAKADISVGEIRQIRLELGSKNSIIKNNFEYHLFAPVGKEQGIIIKCDASMQVNKTYRLWLDFDAARSVSTNGIGVFFLNPVIRVYSDDTGGIIEGVVLPSEARTAIWAIMGSDTLLAYPNSDGYYRFSGLEPSDEWKLVFNPSRMTYYRDLIKDSVTVTKSITTTVSTIKLKT